MLVYSNPNEAIALIEYPTGKTDTSQLVNGDVVNIRLTTANDTLSIHSITASDANGSIDVTINETPNSYGSHDITSASFQYAGSPITVHITSGPFEKVQPTVTAPNAVRLSNTQKLEEAPLVGGNADVAGTWEWVNPNEIPTASAGYPVRFVPTDIDHYATVDTEVSVTVDHMV